MFLKKTYVEMSNVNGLEYEKKNHAEYLLDYHIYEVTKDVSTG